MSRTHNPSLIKTLLLSLLLLFASLGARGVLAATPVCEASSSWITNPNPPSEIPNGSNAQFCDFYQFSWQWFFDLVSPSTSDASLRNFEVAANYPILQLEGDSCAANAPQKVVFVRVEKPQDANTPFIIPERIGQAGGEDTIYDQNGNVVFYDVRFSRNLCNVGQIQSAPQFPAGTTEMKTAWRVITDAEKASYFWMEADIDNVPGTELLGMIGFHMVIATALHPEFIWVTFEHRSNAPDCSNPGTAPASGWSFASAACVEQLPTITGACKFNAATPATSITGPASEICQVFHDGTDPSDHEGADNIAIIDSMNTQIQGFLTALGSDSPMSVWQNYMMVGALWENDVTQPSSIVSNQRGSMRLANTVMETTHQNVDLTSSFVSNCFGCHNFDGSKASNTLPSSGLSHIFDDIMEGQCATPTDVQAGPIWNNSDAEQKCPQTCKTNGGWNGNWTTTEPGKMSVCGCCGG
jgi:hypothetical protein